MEELGLGREKKRGKVPIEEYHPERYLTHSINKAFAFAFKILIGIYEKEDTIDLQPHRVPCRDDVFRNIWRFCGIINSTS